MLITCSTSLATVTSSYLTKFTTSLVAVYFPTGVCRPKIADKAWPHGATKVNYLRAKVSTS